mmetsp:Transcript_20950/g.45279  ORF Transcript_20950/g.45279 Transcript_20950/m.45279 type:complete len:206 (+) Transcript_20950:1397-2014(+)
MIVLQLPIPTTLDVLGPSVVEGLANEVCEPLWSPRHRRALECFYAEARCVDVWHEVMLCKHVDGEVAKPSHVCNDALVDVEHWWAGEAEAKRLPLQLRKPVPALQMREESSSSSSRVAGEVHARQVSTSQCLLDRSQHCLLAAMPHAMHTTHDLHTLGAGRDRAEVQVRKPVHRLVGALVHKVQLSSKLPLQRARDQRHDSQATK